MRVYDFHIPEDSLESWMRSGKRNFLCNLQTSVCLLADDDVIICKKIYENLYPSSLFLAEFWCVLQESSVSWKICHVPTKDPYQMRIYPSYAALIKLNDKKNFGFLDVLKHHLRLSW